MALVGSFSSPPSKAEYCLQQANDAKAAGNAALQSGNVRGAVFQYKKVYLFLVEYLPADVPTPSSSFAASGSCENDGLVQMLQQQRRPGGRAPSPSSSSASTSKEVQQAALRLYATSLNNLALAHLKLGRCREGIACVNTLLNTPSLRAALESGASTETPLTSSTPVGKALLRRASCLAKVGEWAAAAADVKTLTEAHAAAQLPPDPACLQLTEAIAAGRTSETEKEKKMLRRIFS